MAQRDPLSASGRPVDVRLHGLEADARPEPEPQPQPKPKPQPLLTLN